MISHTVARPSDAPAGDAGGDPTGDRPDAYSDAPGDDESAPAGWGPFRGQLAVLALVVFLIRFGFAAPRRHFDLYPDEPATLAMARWLGGGARWNMFSHSTWQPGLGTLLAPVAWLTDDPEVLYRSGLIAVAAIAAASAVVLALLTRRLTGLGQVASVVVAFFVATMPSALSATSFVWAESPVTLVFLLVLAGTIRYFDRPGPAWACAVVGAASVGYLFHNRMLPLLATATLVLAADQIRRRRVRSALTVGLVALAGVIVVRVWARFVIDQVWDEPAAVNSTSSTLRRFAEVDGFPIAIGQVWYQLVASAGLFGIGMIAAVRAARHRSRSGTDHRVLLLYTVAMMGVSVLFLAGRQRTDYYLYGRYNDAIMWPVLAIGAAWLLGAATRERARWANTWAVLGMVAASTILTGVATHLLFAGRFANEGLVRPMIPGLLAYLGARDVEVLVPTVLAIAIMVLLAAVASLRHPRRNQLLALVASVLLVMGAARTSFGIDTWGDAMRPDSHVLATRDVLPDGSVYGVRFVDATRDRPAPVLLASRQARRIQDYQFRLPGREAVEVENFGDAPDVQYVFAYAEDPVMLEGGAEVVWTDPTLPISLWDRRPDDGGT